MSDHNNEAKNPFAQIREADADEMDVSTDVSTNALLNGERSSHFPEKRNRRHSDQDKKTISRLYSALDAIERGETYNGQDNEDSHLMEDFYRQF